MATHPAAASSKSSTATSLRNKNHSGSAVIIQHSITSPAPVTPVIRIKRQNCWWLLGALALIYVIGVHWGVHLAHSSNFVNDDVVSVQDSLQAWSSMWESYVEPMWDSLNGDEDNPSFSSKMYKLVTNSNTNNTTKKKWQPETPRFTAPETLKLPKPIINVGFPKAGTSTIFSFFHCNGLKGQHWFCCEPQYHPQGTEHSHLMSRCILDNLIHNHRFQLNTSQAKRQLFEGCGEYDFYSEINGPRVFHETRHRQVRDDGSLDTRGYTKKYPRLLLPQHHYLEKIHQQFPNATLILNLRPTDEWVQSVMRWTSTLKQEIPNEFWFQDQTRGFQAFQDNATLLKYGITQLPPRKISQINATLAYIMEYHSNYVRDFVRRHPSHALLEVDITDPEAGQKLADAFGLNETCWGHRNQNLFVANGTHPIELLFTNGKFQTFLEQQSSRKDALRQKLAEKKRQQQNAHKTNTGVLQTIWDSVLAMSGNAPEWEILAPEDKSNNIDLADFERTREQRMKRLKGHPKGRDGGRGKAFGNLDGWPLPRGSSNRMEDQEESDDEEEGFAAGSLARDAGGTMIREELETYQVGDGSKEARKARKEIYQERLRDMKERSSANGK